MRRASASANYGRTITWLHLRPKATQVESLSLPGWDVDILKPLSPCLQLTDLLQGGEGSLQS